MINFSVRRCVLDNGYRKVALVFVHGLGDTLMFRSYLDQLIAELTGVSIDCYVLAGFESLSLYYRSWPGWEQMPTGYDKVFEIAFFMAENSGLTKGELCGRDELGLDSWMCDLKPVVPEKSCLAAVHFSATALPQQCNPSEPVARRIWEILSERGLIPIEVHSEHYFHNPVNMKYGFVNATLRGSAPSLDKLRSVISQSMVFVGVASGPMIMALAIDHRRVIYLKRSFDISSYTHLPVHQLGVDPFEEHRFVGYLDEILGQEFL